MPVTDLDGQPMLCVMGGGGAGCGPLGSARASGIISFSGGPKGTHWVGAVPDGVARVRFTPEGGSPKDSIVRENFFEIRVPDHGPDIRVPPPKGWKGPTGKDGLIDGPVGPATGKLEWFDAGGKLIKR